MIIISSPKNALYNDASSHKKNEFLSY